MDNNPTSADSGLAPPHEGKADMLGFVPTYHDAPDNTDGALNLQMNRRPEPSDQPYADSINTPDIRHFHEHRDEMSSAFDARDIGHQYGEREMEFPEPRPIGIPDVVRQDMNQDLGLGNALGNDIGSHVGSNPVVPEYKKPEMMNDQTESLSNSLHENEHRSSPAEHSHLLDNQDHQNAMNPDVLHTGLTNQPPLHSALPDGDQVALADDEVIGVDEEGPSDPITTDSLTGEEPSQAAMEEEGDAFVDEADVGLDAAVDEPMVPVRPLRKIERNHTRPREDEVEDDSLTSFGSFWWVFVAGNYARMMLRKESAPEEEIKQEIEPTISCEDCGDKFNTAEDLEVHGQVHLGSYVHSCSTCQKPFSKLYDLRRHQFKHERKATYSCIGCQQGFRFYSKLKNHHHICESMKVMNPPQEPEEPEEDLEELLRRPRRLRRRKKKMVRRPKTTYVPVEGSGDGASKRKRGRPKKVKTELSELGDMNETEELGDMASIGEDEFDAYFDDDDDLGISHRMKRRYRRRRAKSLMAKEPDINKKNVCKICPDKPEIEDMTMKEHIHEHHPDRVLRCRICPDQIFYKEEYFRKHYLSEHPGKNWFECQVCGRNFKARERWQQHEYLHTGMKQYACDKCPKKFAFQSYLDRHFLNCHKGRELTYFCDKCGKGFKYGHTYKRHMLDHKGRNYPCPICNFFFLTAADLEKHRIVHLDIQKYFCEKCGKGFKYRTGYEEHLKTHNPKTMQCELCPMKFNRKESLVRHQEVHTGKKAAYCEFCSKGFRKKHRLKQHIIAVHSKERPFTCPLCEKSFSTKANMTCHLKSHDESLFRYHCMTCGKRFQFPGKLRDHLSKFPDHQSNLEEMQRAIQEANNVYVPPLHLQQPHNQGPGPAHHTPQPPQQQAQQPQQAQQQPPPQQPQQPQHAPFSPAQHIQQHQTLAPQQQPLELHQQQLPQHSQHQMIGQMQHPEMHMVHRSNMPVFPPRDVPQYENTDPRRSLQVFNNFRPILDQVVYHTPPIMGNHFFPTAPK